MVLGWEDLWKVEEILDWNIMRESIFEKKIEIVLEVKSELNISYVN